MLKIVFNWFRWFSLQHQKPDTLVLLKPKSEVSCRLSLSTNSEPLIQPRLKIGYRVYRYTVYPTTCHVYTCVDDENPLSLATQCQTNPCRDVADAWALVFWSSPSGDGFNVNSQRLGSTGVIRWHCQFHILSDGLPECQR